MQTIYILDYDTDIALVLSAWFRSNGIAAKSFATLEALLLQMQTSQPDCIILDCLFGRVALTADVCRTLQQTFHYSGAILLTSTTAISANDVKTCNANHFIPKPFHFAAMLRLVNTHMTDALVNACSL